MAPKKRSVSRKSYKRKSTSPRRKSYKRKSTSPRRKSYKRKSTSPRRKSYKRKSTSPRRKTYTRKSTSPRTKTYTRKSTSSPKSPSSSSSSSSLSPKIGYYFIAWYESKPSVNNRLGAYDMELKLDDDDEWMFSGDVMASSKEQVKAWLRTLGKVKLYGGYGSERIDVSEIL